MYKFVNYWCLTPSPPGVGRLPHDKVKNAYQTEDEGQEVGLFKSSWLAHVIEKAS